MILNSNLNYNTTYFSTTNFSDDRIEKERTFRISDWPAFLILNSILYKFQYMYTYVAKCFTQNLVINYTFIMSLVIVYLFILYEI